MRVLFLSPHFPDEMKLFAHGLASAGAEVFGVGHMPREQLPEDMHACLADYFHCGNMLDETAATDAVCGWLRKRAVDRVEALIEPLMLLAARLRDRLGCPGMSRATTMLFRDKDLMKKRVREAGLRVPKSFKVHSARELHLGADKIGFPVIIKPISGVGAADTHTLRDHTDIDRLLPRLGHLDEGNLEEMVFGEELTFDTVSVDSVPAFYSVSQYFPTILEASQHEWISPADFTYRNPDIPKLAPGVKLGFDVVKALGAGTSFTHMEWFLTQSGEAVFSEIAARSPGAHLVPMMNWANDFDIAREWAEVVANGRRAILAPRKYNVATIFKRAHGQGKIVGLEGFERVQERCGEAIIWNELAEIGTPRRDWRRDPRGDGFLTVRHQDTRECLAMMAFVASELKLIAE